MGPLNKDTFAIVCDLIASGETTRTACDKVDSQSRYLYDYMKKIGDSAYTQYAHACTYHAEVMADKIMDIANAPGDPRTKQVKIDAIKWLLSKKMPKKYGDRLELSGNTTDLPKRIEVVMVKGTR